MEIKTEADHNDLTECSHDDKPSTGTFAIYFWSVYSVCIVFIYFFILVQKNVKYVDEF